MSSTAAVAAHGAHAEHHELSFLRTYIFSEDHKMIGRQFLFMALFMMSIGGLMAMLMRWELAFPETPVPGFHWCPSRTCTTAQFRPTPTTACSRCMRRS